MTPKTMSGCLNKDDLIADLRNENDSLFAQLSQLQTKKERLEAALETIERIIAANR